MTFSKSENKWMNQAQEINKTHPTSSFYFGSKKDKKPHLRKYIRTYKYSLLLKHITTFFFFFLAEENGFKWLRGGGCTEKLKIPSECKLVWIPVLHLPHSSSIMLLVTLFYFQIHSPLPLPPLPPKNCSSPK